jgi:hypothetical protein
VLLVLRKTTAARRERVSDRPITEAEHGDGELLLRLVDDSGLGALLQQEADLLVGDLVAGWRTGAQEPEYRLGGNAEHRHHRRREPREQAHGLRYPARHSLGVLQREPLRDELSDDERQVGDCEHYRGDAGGLGGPAAQPFALQPVPDGRAAWRHKGAGEDADGGDADLDRGEEAVRLPGQLQSGRRPCIALVGELLQPQLPCGDKRQLRHGEQPVQQDERDEDDDFDGDCRHVKSDCCGSRCAATSLTP